MHGNRRGDLRGVLALRIGTNNRHEGDCGKGLRRWNARGIGAEIYAGYWCRELRGNLRQKIGTEVCRGGVIARWMARWAEKGKGGDRYKKRPRKNRGRTVELIVAGRGGCHPYRQDKTVVVLSPMQGPEFRLSRLGFAGRLYGKLRSLVSSSSPFGTSGFRSGLCFSLRRLSFCPWFPSGFRPPDSFGPPAPCFDPKRLPWFRPRVPTS